MNDKEPKLNWGALLKGGGITNYCAFLMVLANNCESDKNPFVKGWQQKMNAKRNIASPSVSNYCHSPLLFNAAALPWSGSFWQCNQEELVNEAFLVFAQEIASHYYSNAWSCQLI